MVVGSPAERPVVLALGLDDRVFVDAGDAPLHQAIGVEFPVLVAVGAEPEAVVAVVLVGEAHGDAIAGAGPQLLDQAVIELARPLAAQEGFYLGTAVDELGAVAPFAVGRVGQRHPGRVAAVPGILGHADLLGCCLSGEGRHWRPRPGLGHGSPFVTSARSMQSIISRASNGLAKNPTAPSASACRRTWSSGKAVIRMTGMRLPLPARWRCRSSPLMPGIWTSVIRQEAAVLAGDARNASAEAKVATPRSSDASRLRSASRTASSSSTTAMVGVLEQVMSGNCSSWTARESYTNVCRVTAICAAQGARPCAQGLRASSPPSCAWPARDRASRWSCWAR